MTGHRVAGRLRSLMAIGLLMLAPPAWAAAPTRGGGGDSGAVDLYQPLGQMHHTTWTAKDGLIGMPFTLAQTADGYLWIATTNGLYRFDGVAFEHFEPPNGTLPAAAAYVLFPTPDGGLWVGYERGGATFIAADGRIVNYSVAEGLPVGQIRSFARDQEGVMWVAATGGLARLEHGRWRPVRMDWNYPCRSAWRLLVQRDGTLWVAGASPNQLLYLPKGARAFLDAGVALEALSLVQTDDHTILVATNQSEELFEVRREGTGPAISRKVMDLDSLWIATDRQGALWAVAHGVTRMRLDRLPSAAANRAMPADVERFSVEQGLSGRRARRVLVDREHTVWVITENGLDRFRRRNLTWRPDPSLQEGGALVADRNGEVFQLSWASPSIRRASDGAPIPNSPGLVAVAFPDPDGSIWLSPNDQFLRWRDGRFTPVPPPDEVVERGYRFNVLAAAADRSGGLWASVNGVGQFYRKDDRWTFVPVLPNRPDWTAVKAHVDASDRVWLGYREELAMIDRGRVRIFTKAEGLDVGPILAIASRDAEVWVGGERGLARLHGDRFQPVRTALDSNLEGGLGTIVDIVTQDGLWLSAAIGIVHIPDAEARRLRGDPSHRVSYELFDLISDLPQALKSAGGRSVSAVAGAGGILWFLTHSGLVRLDPRQVVRNTVPPPVSIRAVIADDTPYSPREPVSLPPLTRTLRIDYTALSLSIPERVRFRYRLDGWETDWHDAGSRRTVFYTDLKPGRYAFRVLACNNDGVWNETGATLAFTVAPAWYQTTWFQALVIIAIAASIATLYRIRVRRLSAAISARFDERLAERTRIARELHDTLLQTVQGSKMVADDALERLEDALHTRRAMERLAEWLGRAVNEGRAALNSLRASTDEVNDLAESFKRAAADPTKPPMLAVSVEVRGAPRDLHPIVRDEIYRIGYEAIRNAYAHSKGTQLEILLEYASDLTLRVTDNGVGIGPIVAGAGKRGRFGLPGMRERAANIGATLSVVSTASGTAISLVVPGRTVFRRGSAQPS